MIREEIILELAKDKDVLDIGSVGQSSAYSLWNLLLNVKTKSLVGIDLPEAVEVAKQVFSVGDETLPIGGEIVYGDMETYDFGRQFDLIVAGDVIVQVNNQGLFLENIRRHLRPNGKLAITTANAKWFTVALKPNPTHTLWHDQFTLSVILDRSGFKVDYLRYYYGSQPYYNWFTRLLCWRQCILAVCSIKN